MPAYRYWSRNRGWHGGNGNRHGRYHHRKSEKYGSGFEGDENEKYYDYGEKATENKHHYHHQKSQESGSDFEGEKATENECHYHHQKSQKYGSDFEGEKATENKHRWVRVPVGAKVVFESKVGIDKKAKKRPLEEDGYELVAVEEDTPAKVKKAKSTEVEKKKKLLNQKTMPKQRMSACKAKAAAPANAKGATPPKGAAPSKAKGAVPAAFALAKATVAEMGHARRIQMAIAKAKTEIAKAALARPSSRAHVPMPLPMRPRHVPPPRLGKVPQLHEKFCLQTKAKGMSAPLMPTPPQALPPPAPVMLLPSTLPASSISVAPANHPEHGYALSWPGRCYIHASQGDGVRWERHGKMWWLGFPDLVSEELKDIQTPEIDIADPPKASTEQIAEPPKASGVSDSKGA